MVVCQLIELLLLYGLLSTVTYLFLPFVFTFSLFRPLSETKCHMASGDPAVYSAALDL